MITRTSRATIAASVTLAAALLVTGCSGVTGVPTPDRTKSTSADRPGATATNPPTKTAPPAETVDEVEHIGFGNDSLPADRSPAWNMTTSKLEAAGWKLDDTHTDPAQGEFTYINANGMFVTLRQQAIADIPVGLTDEEATRYVFSKAVSRTDLTTVALNTSDGGTIDFLSAEKPGGDGTSGRGLIRMFSAQGIGLLVNAGGPDQAALDAELNTFLAAVSVETF